MRFVCARLVFKIFVRTFQMEKTKIGVIQMTSNHDKQHNFNICKELITKSSESNVKMVFLPECFDYISRNKEEMFELAEPLDGSLISNYKTLAKDLNIWISLGGFHQKIKPSSSKTEPAEQSSQKILNTHIIIDNEGNITSKYDKVHLFDLDLPGKIRLKESDFTQAGISLMEPAMTPIGKMGLLICYDIRFPRASTALCEWGAQVLTYPSAFTVPTGQAHWHVLNRARAIENCCYVISAAQVGTHNAKRSSYGHSLVVNPWGEVLLDMGGDPATSPSVSFVEIDVEFDLGQVRAKSPDCRVPDSVYSKDLNQTSNDLLPLPSSEDATSLEFPFGTHTIHPSSVFARNHTCYAFVNRAPLIPGHVLVTTFRNEAKSLSLDCSNREVCQLFTLAQSVGRALTSYYGSPQGSCNYTVQDGPAAGRTVDQIHIHIIPRHYGDLEGKGEEAKPTDDNAIYRMLEEHDASHKEERVPGKTFRSLEDMSKEAQIYRRLLYK